MKLINTSVADSITPGMLLRLHGTTPDVLQCIYEIDGNAVTFAPWTWIARVISWNPCNDLRMALGVMDDE